MADLASHCRFSLLIRCAWENTSILFVVDRQIISYKFRLLPFEKLDDLAVSALGVELGKLSIVGRSSDGWPKIYYLDLLRAVLFAPLCTSEGTLNWCQLQTQLLAPTNLRWVRMMAYGPFSLCVIHEEGLCPSSGDINRLITMMMIFRFVIKVM
jgi:hypothetical protein